MAQLENPGGLGGRVRLAGRRLGQPLDATAGAPGASPSPSSRGRAPASAPPTSAVFYDKEWLTVDNNPGSPFYGRAYLTTSRFLNGLQGRVCGVADLAAASPTTAGSRGRPPRRSPARIPAARSRPTATPARTATRTSSRSRRSLPNGTLYVHFLNGQNDGRLGGPGGLRRPDPRRAVDRRRRELLARRCRPHSSRTGFSDTPWSVIGSTTVWGHQIRWTACGQRLGRTRRTRSTSRSCGRDRGTPNPNATDGCFDGAPGDRAGAMTRATRARAPTRTSTPAARSTAAGRGAAGGSTTRTDGHQTHPEHRTRGPLRGPLGLPAPPDTRQPPHRGAGRGGKLLRTMTTHSHPSRSRRVSDHSHRVAVVREVPRPADALSGSAW